VVWSLLVRSIFQILSEYLFIGLQEFYFLVDGIARPFSYSLVLNFLQILQPTIPVISCFPDLCFALVICVNCIIVNLLFCYAHHICPYLSILRKIFLPRVLNLAAFSCRLLPVKENFLCRQVFKVSEVT
jgi:hypothetical protein